VYDKTVRRRRTVLGLLVACSLILLTAYFGESGGGSLHAIQGGVLDVVSPIENVANRALSPVRDLFNWVGDTFHAKGQVKNLRKENNQLVTENVALNAQLRQARQLAGLKQVVTNAGLGANRPVSATVIAASPNIWNSTIVIDKGTGDGIREDMPVIGADQHNGALIGTVSFAWRNGARVTLLTDQKSFVSAADVATGATRGGVQATVGEPGDLTYKYAKRSDTFNHGDIVVTAGICSARLSSLFPSDIPIGRVTRVDNPGTSNQVVHVAPLVNLQRVENVQVLTRTDGKASNVCPN
jgi:rod shape-determining protein MreC